MSVLKDIISKDFDLEGTGRWLKVVDKNNGPSSLVVDTEEEIFYYNSKNIVGDALVWLTKVKGMTFDEAKKILKQFETFGGSYIITIKDGSEVVVLPRLVDSFWTAGNSPEYRKYWYNRGIKDSTIDRFRLGHYNGWNTIPIFMDGIFRNFQIRRDEPKKTIKGWYSGIGPLLFNSSILKLSKTVFIAEGPTDCIRLMQEGFPAISHTGGATGWKQEWNKYFLNQERIFYFSDNDEAGVEGAKKVAQNLGEYKVRIVNLSTYAQAQGVEAGKGYDVIDFLSSGFTNKDLLKATKEYSKYSFQLKG